MRAATHPDPAPLADGAIVTKAVLRAAARLQLPNKSLARILGLSEASISRMGSHAYELKPADKAFELAVMFLRLFRSLDAITGGDEAVARAWLRGPHSVLGQTPLSLIESVTGLAAVVAYLDARRALV